MLDKTPTCFERPSGRPGGRAERVNTHVLRVRSAFCAHAGTKLAAPIYAFYPLFNAQYQDADCIFPRNQ
ncbi:hypothetical protein DMT38_24520 [Klebsiella variicola]|nr:hypothetical protein DMT38_24520 [Klebsiella variicola]